MKSVKNKKKFRETKVGAFLTERAPQVVSQMGEFLPDQGALGIVKNLITSDTTIEPQDFTPANFSGLEVAKELLQRLKSSDRDNQSPKHVQIPDVLRLQARVMRDTHVQEHSCQERLKFRSLLEKLGKKSF